MGQVATQPERAASSGAPAHPITARVPAHAASVAPAHAGTVAHTTLPTLGFWAETFKPGVFWTALSALATLLAVVVALVVPFLLDWLQRRRRRWHANAVAQGMFKDAVNAAEAADVAIREVRNLKYGYQDVQRQVAIVRGGTNQFITVPGGIVYNTVMMDYTFSDEAIERLANAARISFDNFKDGRTYLADMSPGWSALLYAKFTDAQHCVSEIDRIVRAWAQPYQMRPRDLEAFERQLHTLLAVMRVAGFSLAALAGEEVPEHWHPRGAMRGE